MTRTELAKARRRRAAMVAMRGRGAKLDAIALRFGVSKPRVSQILKSESTQQIQKGKPNDRKAEG